ncbi:hypothetical protein L6452_40351 [Arctium lappa]|uniref:Uncharacterized protein n=1 Tax=Arctium lappa TaxID=4217 RepID=A0ACB8XLP1_ARCLA|nr:hypothetical protein L6452_40351 [Arctium lappa]
MTVSSSTSSTSKGLGAMGFETDGIVDGSTSDSYSSYLHAVSGGTVSLLTNSFEDVVHKSSLRDFWSIRSRTRNKKSKNAQDPSFALVHLKNALTGKRANSALRDLTNAQTLASLKFSKYFPSSYKMTSKDALSIGTDVKPPVLFKGEYERWKDKFLDFVDRHANGENILLSITEGPMIPPTVQIPDGESSDSEDGDEERVQKMRTVPMDFAQYSEEQKSRFKVDKQARSLLLQSIPNEIYIKIDSYKANAKKMWDQLQKMMMGFKVGNQMKVAN